MGFSSGKIVAAAFDLICASGSPHGGPRPPREVATHHFIVDTVAATWCEGVCGQKEPVVGSSSIITVLTIVDGPERKSRRSISREIGPLVAESKGREVIGGAGCQVVPFSGFPTRKSN